MPWDQLKIPAQGRTGGRAPRSFPQLAIFVGKKMCGAHGQIAANTVSSTLDAVKPALTQHRFLGVHLGVPLVVQACCQAQSRCPHAAFRNLNPHTCTNSGSITCRMSVRRPNSKVFGRSSVSDRFVCGRRHGKRAIMGHRFPYVPIPISLLRSRSRADWSVLAERHRPSWRMTCRKPRACRFALPQRALGAV